MTLVEHAGLPDLESGSAGDYSMCRHGTFVWENFIEMKDVAQTNE